MRGVITNERILLEEALNGRMEERTINKLILMTKMYFARGKSIDEVIKLLNKHMDKYYKGYVVTKWASKIKQIVTSSKKTDNFKIRDIKEVVIYKDEWDRIMELEVDGLRRVAFVLLVYGKLNEAREYRTPERIYNNITDILTEANVRVLTENKKMIKDLVDLGYVKLSNSCNASSIDITFLSKEKEEEFIKINDFRNVLSYYYEITKKKEYIKCEICGVRVEKRTCNSRVKYCKECYKKQDNNNRNNRKR